MESYQIGSLSFDIGYSVEVSVDRYGCISYGCVVVLEFVFGGEILEGGECTWKRGVVDLNPMGSSRDPRGLESVMWCP